MCRRISYEQAREDREYLWSISPAYDMTGGYVDQDDLQRLLENPTKATARDCYRRQINYWFERGPQEGDRSGEIPWYDARVVEIAERHCIATPLDALEDDEE